MIFSREAPKITGMLLDCDKETLNNYRNNKAHLKRRVDEAYNVIFS